MTLQEMRADRELTEKIVNQLKDMTHEQLVHIDIACSTLLSHNEMKKEVNKNA